MKENELQNLLIKDIQNNSLFEKITRLHQNSSKAHHSSNFFNRLIERRYGNSVRAILKTLKGDIEIINNVGNSIKSISLDNKSLYPDILATSIDSRDYLIFELKTDAATERQALMELYAYEAELINHLPRSHPIRLKMHMSGRSWSISIRRIFQN